MIPLGPEATDTVLSWSDGLHRTSALHHAAIHGRPGLWGDDPARPSSVLWLRDGGTRWEAFAAGFADPALDWLIESSVGRPIVLAAPASWEAVIRARVEPAARVELSLMQAWLRPGPGRLSAPVSGARALGPDDADAFAAIAPPWALRSWGDFGGMLAGGAAFGVPSRSGLAAVAWVVESDHHLDKIGVATDPRFRRLGLGRAVASALIAEVEEGRRRHALWVANPENVGSLGLARALGFTTQWSEPLLRWAP